MKKTVDKLKKYIHVNRKIFVFLLIILVVGIIAGTIFSLTLNKEDNVLVQEYLNTYISSVSNNKINYVQSLINTIGSATLVTLVIWLLGLSVVGIPIILILFFYKSFAVGFSLGSILINYKIRGVLLSVIYTFPHHIINLLLLITLIIYAFIISSKILEAVVKRKEINFRPITYKYLIILGLVIGSGIVLSLYESFVVPMLVKLVLPILT